LEAAVTVDLGRDVCGAIEVAERREWLVTNGLGGYASGTLAGLPTRRYHGLLVASLRPPVERYVIVSKFDEVAAYDDDVYELAATRWHDGTIAPAGFRFIERFRLEGTTPVWSFAFGDALLEKRVWMERGHNTTYVTYTVVRASRSVELRVKALAEARAQHALRHADAVRTAVTRIDGGIRCEPPGGLPPFFIFCDAPIIRDMHEWYLGVSYARERERGLDDVGDHLHVGDFAAQLEPGATLAFALSMDADASTDVRAAWDRQQRAEDELLQLWTAADPERRHDGPAWIRQLALAADQFVVQRARADGGTIPTIVAGYPWFADWGRDTMIALPGLLLRTGRADLARAVLRAWAGFVDGGLLPNAFLESGATPIDNSVDAALLFIDAVHRLVRATEDRSFAEELLPTLTAIVQAYADGTRHGIGVDPADGLLHAGEPGIAVTWMDARVGDFVVTPRIGKPVEVNALWYHGLCACSELAAMSGRDAGPYRALADRAKAGFHRFWDASEGYCFDVLDGPGGNDLSLRPNQLFAVALEHRALGAEQQRAVFDACARSLLTSYGCRTLARDAPGYVGAYGGSPGNRDAAYHQGTAWPWLIGPFVRAALNVGVDRATAATYLEPLGRALCAYGVGTLFEIGDGDAPHTPNGCIAQAWSVANALDAWCLLARTEPQAD
jgi:predicted glycogen debranching enzyme